MKFKMILQIRESKEFNKKYTKESARNKKKEQILKETLRKM